MTSYTETDTTVATGSPEAEKVAARLIRYLGTLEGAEDVLTPDVFVDLNVPLWRMQAQGTEAFESLIREETDDGQIIHDHRVVPTPTGFVLEYDGELTHKESGQNLYFRNMWLCEIRNGRISEVTVYCTGEWDEQARRTQAEEAPMLR